MMNNLSFRMLRRAPTLSVSSVSTGSNVVADVCVCIMCVCCDFVVVTYMPLTVDL